MSKGGFTPDLGAVDPTRQIGVFAAELASSVNAAARERLEGTLAKHRLLFDADVKTVVAALDTPQKVQRFLNEEIYYNNDHPPGQVVKETALAPLEVLARARAHCFEGALFAYMVNFLHGHAPQLVLLEATGDSDHNLVVYRQEGRWGCNAHSAFPRLDGREPNYGDLRALCESYHPHYYSDRSHNPSELTLVGYSEPFDLVKKYGTAWMASRAPLWPIYFTYVDASVRFRYLFDDSDRVHLYPVNRALAAGWIAAENGKPMVQPAMLPTEARRLWDAFWAAGDEMAAQTIAAKFRALTDTTPRDLVENAEDLEAFFAHGHRVEELL